MTQSVEKGEPRYLALIGDLKASRELPNRHEAQERLADALEEANQALALHQAARLVITVGDEFQGLFRAPAAVLDLLTFLDQRLPEIKIRFGLGWGTLSTARLAEAIGMDGPCFHAARDALKLAKDEERWVAVNGFGSEHDKALNGIFSLLGSVRAQWTAIQAATVAEMRTAETQKEVAERRGVATSTIHKALQGALYGPVREAEESLRLLLTSLTTE